MENVIVVKFGHHEVKCEIASTFHELIERSFLFWAGCFLNENRILVKTPKLARLKKC